jgi:hypothetical protein
MSDPEFKIQVSTDIDDVIVAIKPPVDNTFRELLLDMLGESQLVREIAVRGIITRHSSDGSAYSELRLSNTALAVAGKSLIELAHQSAKVLQDQKLTAIVDPYLRSSHGTQRLFE